MRTLTLKPYLAIILTLAWSIVCTQAQFTFSHVGGGPTGTFTPNPDPGSFTLVGGGNDIWDMLDEFDFAHVDITGDFDIAVKLEAIEAANRWTKAGIMARETLAPESRMAFSKGSPSGPSAGNTVCNEDINGAADVSLMYRTWIPGAGGNGGQHEDRLVPDPGYPGSPWVRLQREGNIIRGYASADGVNWNSPVVQNTANWVSPVGGAPTPLAATLKVGLGVSRHGCSVLQGATVQYRNLQAPQISGQPQNQTVEQGFPATFRIGLAGLANWQVQWMENGVEIPGATGRTYTTADAQVSHSGRRYSARARDTISGAVFTSSEAVLSVIPDVTAPSLVSATGPANNPIPASFDVLFSEPVSQASAQTIANYAVSGLTLNSATLQADGRTVRIASSPLRGAGCLVLTVNGVQDRAGNTIAPNSTTIVYWDTGTILYERYNGLAGGAVANLTGNAKYPNSPDVTEYLTELENPGDAGDHGENWGARHRGYITAPVSGNFVFAIASDDQSEFWLSTDENPANKVMIAREPEWAGFREFVYHGADDRGDVNANRGNPPSNISVPKALTRGCRYYFEYLFAEGCCGDNASVTWQLPGGPALVNGQDVIQGANLSPWRAAPSQDATLPANLTVFANQSASFTVKVTGFPTPAIQWYRNGAAIAGATSATYTIPLAAESDSGATFYAVATSAMGSAQSRTATLTVLVDNQAPTIVSADAPLGVSTQFNLVFSEPVNEADAENLAGYSLSGGVTLNSAELQADNRTVRFTCSSLYTAGCKVLTVPSIRDRAIPPNVMPSGVIGVVAAVGTIRYHQFNGIDTVNIPALLADPDFPNNPDVIAYKTSIEGPDNDGGNNFQDYGGQFLGWVHPPVSGDYRFYLAADDHAELYLSTDEDPANKVLIASEPVWANFREWTGPAAGQGGRPCSTAIGTPDTACMNVSRLIPLQRGCKYFLEFIFKEDGGGDYGSVTWQLPGGAVPLNGSAPTIVAAHLSPFDIPPRVLSEPSDITEQEGRIVTFTANIVAPQIVLQWYRDGVAIPGATALSYTIGPLRYPEDNGARFTLVATNPLGTATTRAALLTVIEDNVPPDMVAAAGSTTLDRVTASFSERMEEATAADAFNYAIAGGTVAPAVVSASISADGKTVTLLLDPGTPLELNTDYTVTVFNVNDFSGNQLVTDSASFHSVVEGCGGLIFEAYNTEVAGNAVSILTSDSDFPNNPDFRTTIPDFDSTLAGGIYANNGREQYGARVRGLYVPPSSGDYVFYLRSDDAGQLFLNPNGASPAGKVMIAEQPNCCNTLGDEAISSRNMTLNLVGGQPYYIEALYKEGTGGDYVQVGARIRGSTDPVVPVPGRDLGRLAVPGLTGTLTVQGPADQSVEDNRTATFSVTATSSAGLPICYQWYRDGVAIPGANSASYSLLATLADNGAVFTVRASIVGNAVDSSAATLRVTIDDVKPRVLSAKGADTFRNVYVKWNELMDAATAADPFNYTVSGGLTVDDGELLADGVTVRLTTSIQTPGTVYQVLVQGAADAAGNIVDENYDTAQFKSFVFSCGLAIYEGYYDIGSGVAVADLLAAPKFPDSPDETRIMNMFDTVAILGTTDYRNNSGGRVHGVFVPPTSGNWIFYLRSDDASQLFLNPAGIDPAGKVLLTEETACCGNFSGHASAPQPLVAGQHYYIEGLYKEGGGGDYIQVAAKLDSDPTPPDNLRGIGSSMLGIYAEDAATQITVNEQPVSQTACLDPLSPTVPSVTFSAGGIAAPEGTVLRSENFNSGNGGYSVLTETAFAGAWVYNLTGGVWRADGQDPELNAPMTSRLTSPPITVNQAGVVRVRLVHRWSFEYDGTAWDGGQLRVSVNGGPFVAVAASAFTEGGYSGAVAGNSRSVLAGQSAFISTSAGHGAGTRVTSVAVLGNFSPGDTVAVQFLYAGDTNTRGAVPNWEIDSVTLNEGGAAALPVLVQWQQNRGTGWSDIPGALGRTLTFTPTLAMNGGKVRAVLAAPGTTCTTSAEATLTVIQKNTPPKFDLGSSASANEDAGAQSVPGFASNIQPHSIPRNTKLTFDNLPPNTELYGTARLASGVAHLTDAANSIYGALALNLPAVQNFSTFELSWKSYIGGGGGGGADGYSVNIGDDLGGDPGYGGEEGKGTKLIITVDTFNNADIRTPADEGISIMWGGPYNAGGTEIAFQMIPKDNPGNGNYLRKSAFVDAKLTVSASGVATLVYDGNTISGQLPNYAGLPASRILFWARTGNANDNQWIDDVSGSEWINNFLVDTASVEDSQSVSFEVSNDNPALFSQQPSISPNGTLAYAPAPNACGQATVTVVARDNGGVACSGDDSSDAKMFTINVICGNDCPTATPQSVTAITGVPLGITLTGTDPDGDALTAAVGSNPQHGSLSVVGGVLTYLSAPGYLGPDSFTFTVSDGTCTSGPATVSINVLGNPNLPPRCVASVAPTECGVILPNSGRIYTIAVDGSSACLALSSTGSTDPDGDSLTFTWVIDGTNTVSGAIVTSCLSVGCHIITMTASDGKGGTCQSTLEVCVITPSEACEQLIALVESTTVERKNKRPLIVSLKAAKDRFENDSLDVGAQMLQVFRHKVAAQIARTNPAEAALFDAAAEDVIEALECASNLPPRNDE